MDTSEGSAPSPQSNVSALPKDRGVQLYPMDPDQARYHSMKLRALADLLEAGEPARFAEPFYSDEVAHVSLYLNRAKLNAAELAVRRRVEEGDPDYSIKVEHRPVVRRDRRGRPY